MLNRGVERARDDQLGLKLGATMRFGAGGSFDFAVRTAPTLAESLAVASKYSSLLTDSFHVAVEYRGQQVIVHLEDDVSWTRSAADFAMSAIYRLHLAEPLARSRIDCWFPYAAPSDTSEYEGIFDGTEVKFGAPFFGFAFDRTDAQAPMAGSDPELHAILRARVDALLAELRNARPLSAMVRRLIAEEIRSGDATAERVARSLHMSRRTLTRRLEGERTSFQDELDAVRRRIAIEHIVDARVPISEVAFVAGFSHVESFHRAFKRWTGQTPLAYRTAAPSERTPEP